MVKDGVSSGSLRMFVTAEFIEILTVVPPHNIPRHYTYSTLWNSRSIKGTVVVHLNKQPALSVGEIRSSLQAFSSYAKITGAGCRSEEYFPKC